MYQSKLFKYLLVITFGLIPAGFAHAQDFTYNDKTWEIPVSFTVSATRVGIRNSQSAMDITHSSIFGKQITDSQLLINPEGITGLEKIAAEIDQAPIAAQLIITNGRATSFEPGQNGQKLDLYNLRQMLDANKTKIDLPVLTSEPTRKLVDTNNLGINELVSVGVSDFSGSPRNRIVNITVGADKFNGLIIKPGQEFSFNQYLGDVDGEHGFLPELVIKPGGVVPEFGGGLCQVSTTTFRAAMNAGLPITARRNHSFAVQYYAPQGTDATIYPGVSDLKFTNNLPSSFLIRTRIEGRKLYFEFYGTKDERQVAFDGPTQYDKKANGAMKATWTRHVTLAGVTSTQTFNSNYLPPALFHPVAQATTPNPQAPAPEPNEQIPPPAGELPVTP